MEFSVQPLGNIEWYTEIPKELSERLRLCEHLFYPLPSPLLELVGKHLTPSIGQAAFAGEKEIAGLANQRDATALRSGMAVQYPYLFDRKPALTIEILREAGSKEPEKALAELDGVLRHAFRYSQAYCGWLVSQAAYWSDLNQLVGNQDRESSEPRGPLPALICGKFPELTTSEQAIDTQPYKEFYEKWRLQTLATCDLPVCISPQLAATNIYNPTSPAGTINPVIPDIFPIDGKGIVSGALEAASRSVHAPHLESWKDLIYSSSKSKKRLDTYRRRFVLQHYWRVLIQRYPEALARKVGVLDSVFASFFDVSTDMIKSDRSELVALLKRPLGRR